MKQQISESEVKFQTQEILAFHFHINISVVRIFSKQWLSSFRELSAGCHVFVLNLLNKGKSCA